MKRSAIARIQLLESRRFTEQPLSSSGRSVPFIEALLANWAVTREGNESLAEAFARAVGISCQELKLRLKTGALTAASGTHAKIPGRWR